MRGTIPRADFPHSDPGTGNDVTSVGVPACFEQQPATERRSGVSSMALFAPTGYEYRADTFVNGLVSFAVPGNDRQRASVDEYIAGIAPVFEVTAHE
jgi:hypothetical protein